MCVTEAKTACRLIGHARWDTSRQYKQAPFLCREALSSIELDNRTAQRRLFTGIQSSKARSAECNSRAIYTTSHRFWVTRHTEGEM
ncbi:hypothetical protein T265_01500 [Opisthorchis viverrini]|uniref:Uncharacterized protein n=1 Tax=Opisthorchis viverrini TaxID=6198 RepID=A0A075A2G5_OPIVI|nr:hypothetical protein T265_01500 [Opisthorchis viverrini]KER32447.1 hypothetical protein T265_01500 [Opisthorchis viverrini]